MIALEPGPATPVTGRLALVFRPGARGTSLAHSHVAAPLTIVRPFELDGRRALVQILTLGPGLCAGDHYHIEITVEPGARAVVIMQAASRILGMPDGACATQTIDGVVGQDAQLEYYPGLTIPFADSCLHQRITIAAEPGARVGILENWAMGRHSRGEYLRFRQISSRALVTLGGEPVFADALEIEPRVMDAAAAGLLEKFRYVASGFWHGVPQNASLAARSTAVMAFDRSSNRDQVFLRALASDGYEMATTLQSAVDAIDSAWGFAPIPFRRFAL